MDKLKLHILHTGSVFVSPYLAFNPDRGGLLKVSGVFMPKKEKVWLPVSCYYIEHPKGKVLVDTGWDRKISPDGVYDSKAQAEALYSRLLVIPNKGLLPKGEAVDEQLAAMGVSTSELDYVVLTHLDCDHVGGLKQVADAKKILVSEDEMKSAHGGSIENRIRYQKGFWEGVPLTTIAWNGTEGPFKESFDLFGDGTIQLVHIPGHSVGLCAVKITGRDGKFILLTSDGAYSKRNWQEMVPSGIHDSYGKQMKSLEWIRQQGLSENCIDIISTHDPDVKPHVEEIEL